eukprot:TRINITY_DN9288_c0_g3_i1.p1 TRINITY_DN9288_c0_g3~~TRINITY_DN9288_c0_g3_i1.p1  ORF type:complete len:293 (-),score=25.76 TRINITY_DN9288_c0_g3_i1:88-966(-)
MRRLSSWPLSSNLSRTSSLRAWTASSMLTWPRRGYRGKRDMKDLILFVNEKLGASVKVPSEASPVVSLTPESFKAIASDARKTMLLQFHTPWCKACKLMDAAFEQLAAVFKSEPHIVIARMDGEQYADVAKEQGATLFPTIKWYSGGSPEGEYYYGGRDVSDFLTFVNKRAGTSRAVGGGLSDAAGRLPSLDAIASAFLAAAESDRSALMERVEGEVAKLEPSQTKQGSLYLKVMKSILEKGDDYVEKEQARLAKLLQGALSPNKMDELKLKKNVISSFVPQEDLNEGYESL